MLEDVIFHPIKYQDSIIKPMAKVACHASSPCNTNHLLGRPNFKSRRTLFRDHQPTFSLLVDANYLSENGIMPDHVVVLIDKMIMPICSKLVSVHNMKEFLKETVLKMFLNEHELMWLCCLLKKIEIKMKGVYPQEFISACAYSIKLALNREGPKKRIYPLEGNQFENIQRLVFEKYSFLISEIDNISSKEVNAKYWDLHKYVSEANSQLDYNSAVEKIFQKDPYYDTEANKEAKDEINIKRISDVLNKIDDMPMSRFPTSCDIELKRKKVMISDPSYQFNEILPKMLKKREGTIHIDGTKSAFTSFNLLSKV